MARLQVTISANGLEARLRVTPGPIVTVEDLRNTIEAAGVVHGIDEAAIEQLAARLADPSAGCAIVIAHGTPATKGSDGQLVGDRLTPPTTGKVGEGGEIDYRERLTLQPIRVDEAIAEIVDAGAGSTGRDVRGKPLIGHPGKAFPERLGEGLRQVGNRVLAARDGVVLHTDRLLDVVPLYTHAGDVDYRTGNLHTGGSLRIEGDVKSGFAATAGGDIEIRGTAEDAAISAAGSVVVGHGILGHSHVIRAGRNLLCHHATSAHLIAGHSITVDDNVVQSTLRAPRIYATGPRGVRGGALFGTECIAAETLGCGAGSTTLVAVGDDSADMADAARRQLETARVIRPGSQPRRPGCRLADRGGKAKRSAVRASDTERTLQVRLQRERREQLAAAWVRVAKVCYPGTVIRFGDAELRPDTELGPSTFRYDSDRNEVVQEELP